MATRNATQRPLRAVAWGVVVATFTFGPDVAATATDAAIGMCLAVALAVCLVATRNT